MFDIFYLNNPIEGINASKVESIEEACQLSKTRFCWVLHYLCDYSDFDFLWEPKPWELHQRHGWSSQWQQDSETYLVPKGGYEETHYHLGIVPRFMDDSKWEIPNGINSDNFDFSWHPDVTESPYIYQFGTQWQKTGGPRYVVSGASGVKYVRDQVIDAPIDMANWEIPNGINSDNFDFSWHPDATNSPYIYQFGTQHQKTGGPKYIVHGASTVKYVSQIVVENISISNDNVYMIDHGNIENDITETKLIDGTSFSNVVKTRFISSYLGTLRRIVKKVSDDYIWVTSSLCDYSDFDFSWHPEKWQGTMLHVFASEDQRFGDTFLINVDSFKDRIDNTELLEWYDTINFVDDIYVKRWDIPRVHVDDNSIVDDIKTHEFKSPLVLFTNIDDEVKVPTINLWREKTRVVAPLSDGGNTTVVSRDAKNHIITQVYDYPFVSKKYKTLKDNPQDIVYISNGEAHADVNWNHLKEITRNIPNRLVRVDKVKGRAEAYKEAAKQSNTAWFFAVFAKLEVNPEFSWDWQPDRLQEDKHYIFHALNPIVGVEYGHAAIIAYHKQLVLGNPSHGLDFTLDQEHEVVPLRSGTTYYDNDIHTAWRTSFRESIKLHEDVLKTNSIESEYRLSKWCSSNGTEVGDWNMKGGLDGVDYYNEVNGDFDSLRLTYEWEWLDNRFKQKYGQI
jgi:hypothetical protein